MSTPSRTVVHATISLIALFVQSTGALSYPIFPPERSSDSVPRRGPAVTRRRLLAFLASAPLLLPAIAPATSAPPASPAAGENIVVFRAGSAALGSLLANWERATTDCNYADVPRELLGMENKAELLEKAKVSALFDKSASVVSCKRVVGTVREYLGSTGIGPLAGIEGRMIGKKGSAAEMVGEDDLEGYYTEVDFFLGAVNRASTQAYMARRDFDSMNNFAPGDRGSVSGGADGLDGARLSVADAKASLDKIISMLGSGGSGDV